MLSYNKQSAIDKLNGLIESGRATAAAVIEHVMTSQPMDRLGTANNMKFRTQTDSNGLNPVIQMRSFVPGRWPQEYGIHKHALAKMGDTAHIPANYLSNLRETVWGTELLAHTLNEHFIHELSDKTFLLRSLPVGEDKHQELRGFLSDKYRRLDSRPIVETFAAVVKEAGAFPYKGYVTDTKIALQAIFPHIYEPIPGELLAYGISLENSDFGNGALSLRSHGLRIWCDNLHIFEETMRQVHLGKRLDGSVFYSRETYELDAKTTVSAMKDVISTQFSLPVIDEKMKAIENAASRPLTLDAAKAMLKGLQLSGSVTKAEAERVANVFELGGIDTVPEGMSMWRMSNALSWIAGDTSDSERKLQLLKTAGEMVTKAA